MNLLIGVVIGGILLAVLEARHQTIGATAALTVGNISDAPVVSPSTATPNQIMVGSSAVDGIGIQAAGNALNAIPVVGQFVSQAFKEIAGIFLAAHQQRLKQAINENAACDNFITRGFDPGIATVVNAYNRRQISGAEAVKLLDSLWQHYWAEVTPVIQPGRNGCNGGAAIDYSVAHPPTGTVAQHCGGSWGAACCLGAEVIGSTMGRLQQAIIAVDRNGGSRRVTVSPIYANKYSSFTRPAYPVTVQN